MIRLFGHHLLGHGDTNLLVHADAQDIALGTLDHPAIRRNANQIGASVLLRFTVKGFEYQLFGTSHSLH